MSERKDKEGAGLTLQVIAYIHSEFPEKFGIPRQSGLVEELQAEIVFEPEFRCPDALRGLEDFSHLWLLWEFSQNRRQSWSPTVRPPRLGGNTRLGVFATRSPFRPNPLGLSCVKLEEIRLQTANGPTLLVRGADLLDNTPIYDIKPYLPFTDSRPEASGGFAQPLLDYGLTVVLPPELAERVPAAHLAPLRAVLAQDPRPAYQDAPQRLYGLEFAGLSVKFQVEGRVLTVRHIQQRETKA